MARPAPAVVNVRTALVWTMTASAPAVKAVPYLTATALRAKFAKYTKLTKNSALSVVKNLCHLS